ncbi:hypothetical protein [Trinickia dinghuensis]|nr:hypothetical protein [Trinickia dinghuensis]
MNTVMTFQESPGDPDGDWPLLLRTYLSTSYLTSAALLAKKAYEIEIDPAVRERGFGVVERDEHHACASAAIIMSALGVEAFVNELFADCEAAGGRNLFGLSSSRAEKLARVWRQRPPKREHGRRRRKQTDDFQLQPSLSKYARVLRELCLPRLDFKTESVKAMQTLIMLRNVLAHYKLAIRTVDGQGEQRARTDLEQRLRAVLPDHDPMSSSDNSYIPDGVIGHTVAEWSVRTAVAFLEDFRQLLSVTPQPGHRWPTQVMLMTR